MPYIHSAHYVKMPTVACILTYIRLENVMLSCVKHDKSIITTCINYNVIIKEHPTVCTVGNKTFSCSTKLTMKFLQRNVQMSTILLPYLLVHVGINCRRSMLICISACSFASQHALMLICISACLLICISACSDAHLHISKLVSMLIYIHRV